MYTIGLDIGTTTLSALVLDNESGQVLKTVTLPNNAGLNAPEPWMRLQDPERIAKKAHEIAESLKASYPSVAAIGVDGQMHGILYLDSKGAPVSPLYTWQDGRGDQPYAGETYASALARATGLPMNTGFGLTTHFWHVVNGQVPSTAAVLCTIFDYVAMRLAGRTKPLCHVSGAASLGLWRCQDAYWNEHTLGKAGLNGSLLPDVA